MNYTVMVDRVHRVHPVRGHRPGTAAAGQRRRPGPPVRSRPYHSFRGLLEHLATLTRNQVRYTGTQVTIAMLTEPTSTQRQAFELIGTAIPLTLK